MCTAKSTVASSAPISSIAALRHDLKRRTRHWGPLKGAFGLQASNSQFSALGAEALVPATRSRTQAVYLYEELGSSAGKLSVGGRYELAGVGAKADGNLVDASTGQLRFPTDQSSRFGTGSASIGWFYPLTREWSTTANLARTGRAPTFNELYAYGQHGATGTYEIGNAAFTAEKSNALDMGLNWKSGPHSASISAYQTRFDNYITGFASGRNRDANGTINPAGALREFIYRAAPAQLAGFEAQGRMRLMENGGTLYLEAKADAVRATSLLTKEGLPRIAPARLGLALNYAMERATFRIEANHSAAQTRVPAGDLPTDGFTMWNAYASYRLSVGSTRVLAWLKATNLTNTEARMATSILRDTLPLGARALSAGLRLDF